MDLITKCFFKIFTFSKKFRIIYGIKVEKDFLNKTQATQILND